MSIKPASHFHYMVVFLRQTITPTPDVFYWIFVLNLPFPGVVGVRHGSELLELRLELGVGDTLVDAVDKELAALLSVGGHLVDPSGLSLSLKPNKSVDEGPGFPVTM